MEQSVSEASSQIIDIRDIDDFSEALARGGNIARVVRDFAAATEARRHLARHEYTHAAKKLHSISKPSARLIPDYFDICETAIKGCDDIHLNLATKCLAEGDMERAVSNLKWVVDRPRLREFAAALCASPAAKEQLNALPPIVRPSNDQSSSAKLHRKLSSWATKSNNSPNGPAS